MSKFEKQFRDIRTEHLEIGPGWQTRPMVKASVPATDPVVLEVDNGAGTFGGAVGAASGAHFFDFKFVDDMMFFQGRVLVSGSTVNAGNGFRINIAGIDPLRAATATNATVGTFLWSSPGNTAAYTGVIIASGDNTLGFLGPAAGSVFATPTYESDMLLTFSGAVPLKRVDH